MEGPPHFLWGEDVVPGTPAHLQAVLVASDLKQHRRFFCKRKISSYINLKLEGGHSSISQQCSGSVKL